MKGRAYNRLLSNILIPVVFILGVISLGSGVLEDPVLPAPPEAAETTTFSIHSEGCVTGMDEMYIDRTDHDINYYNGTGLDDHFSFGVDNRIQEVVISKERIQLPSGSGTSCTSGGIGGSSGIGGIGGGYGGTAGNGGDHTVTAPPKDPCARARELAEKLRNALSDPKVKEALSKLMKDFKNAKLEHGFTVRLTDTGYEVSEIVTGSENSTLMEYDARIILTVHTHPPGSSVVHSSTDIYSLADHMDNPNFIGAMTVQGNNVHLLSITNQERYQRFLLNKNKYYDKDARYGWQQDSKISDDFNSFSSQYAEMYRGVDATYPTQLYLMDRYKMGVTLQRMNADGSFSAIKTNANRKMGTGAGTTMNMGGQTINSDYDRIEIIVDCK